MLKFLIALIITSDATAAAIAIKNNQPVYRDSPTRLFSRDNSVQSVLFCSKPCTDTLCGGTHSSAEFCTSAKDTSDNSCHKAPRANDANADGITAVTVKGVSCKFFEDRDCNRNAGEPFNDMFQLPYRDQRGKYASTIKDLRFLEKHGTKRDIYRFSKGFLPSEEQWDNKVQSYQCKKA